MPIAKFDGFFQLLAKAEEVIDGKTKERLRFDDQEWQLELSVNFSMVGNVLFIPYMGASGRKRLLSV